MKTIRKLLSEPLLLVLICGFLLFFSYTSVSSYVERKNRRITVSTDQVQLLAQTFTKTWNRPPTESELNAQVENHIKDQIFYQEAVAIGLDRTDQAVKRRLRQLMELMLDDYASIIPSEDQLQQYLTDHPEKFSRDPRISFQHIYFPMEERQGALDLLSGIQQGTASKEELGGGMALIPPAFEDASKTEVERTFGATFSSAIFELEVRDWQGPVESAYGWHLVKIDMLVEGEVPPLNDVWDEVEREWSFEKRQILKDDQYQKMRERYIISIETPAQD